MKNLKHYKQRKIDMIDLKRDIDKTISFQINSNPLDFNDNEFKRVKIKIVIKHDGMIETYNINQRNISVKVYHKLERGYI